MADTHDIGPFYWHWAWYTPDARAPFFDVTTTTEIDFPYRVGTSTVWKLPASRKALVLGKWRSRNKDEESAILAATGGRVVRPAGILEPGEDL